MIPPECSFGNIAVQMLLGVLMKDPVVTTLDQGDETFSRVGGHLTTIGICPNMKTLGQNIKAHTQKVAQTYI